MSHINVTYHIVWRTKCSEMVIPESHERELLAYLVGICRGKNCPVYRINSMPNHIHLCVEIPPMVSISAFMQVLKQESSKWLREHKELFPNFRGWGNGYAVFSYSAKERPNIVEYIKNQKVHHQTKTFRQEYEEWLREMGDDPKDDSFLND